MTLRNTFLLLLVPFKLFCQNKSDTSLPFDEFILGVRISTYEGQVSLISDSISARFETSIEEREQIHKNYQYHPAESKKLKVGQVTFDQLSFGTTLDTITSIIFSKAYFKTDSTDERMHVNQEYQNLQEYLDRYLNKAYSVYKPATKDGSRTISHSCIWIIDKKTYQLTEVIFKTDKEIKKTVALLTLGIYK